jgi:hypothetical protein
MIKLNANVHGIATFTTTQSVVQDTGIKRLESQQPHGMKEILTGK